MSSSPHAQVSVVTEAGERNLVVARNVKTKPAKIQILSRPGIAIQHDPAIALLDLVHDLIRFHPDLQRAETLLLILMGNLRLLALLSIADHGAIKIIVIHLKEHV